MVFGWFTAVAPLTPEQEHRHVLTLRNSIPAEVATTLAYGDRDVKSDAFLRRWLVAHKWDVEASSQALFQHANWLSRHSAIIPVDRVDVAAVLPHEIKQRKLFFQGQDVHGRPIMYVKFAASKPSEVPLEERTLGLIWGMEWMSRFADKLPGSDGKITIVFDMRGCSSEQLDSQGASLMVEILQKQYPERLAKLLVYEAPSAFWLVWNLVWPFLTTETQNKVKMLYEEEGLSELLEILPPQIVPLELGGEAELVFCTNAIDNFKRNGCL